MSNEVECKQCGESFDGEEWELYCCAQCQEDAEVEALGEEW